jgi:hypothetical protein
MNENSSEAVEHLAKRGGSGPHGRAQAADQRFRGLESQLQGAESASDA